MSSWRGELEMSRHATGKRDKCSEQWRLHPPQPGMAEQLELESARWGVWRSRFCSGPATLVHRGKGILLDRFLQQLHGCEFWNSFWGVFSDEIIHPLPPFQTPRGRCQSVPPRHCRPIMCSAQERCSSPVALHLISTFVDQFCLEAQLSVLNYNVVCWIEL